MMVRSFGSFMFTRGMNTIGSAPASMEPNRRSLSSSIDMGRLVCAQTVSTTVEIDAFSRRPRTKGAAIASAAHAAFHSPPLSGRTL